MIILWRCPFCNHNATITAENYSEHEFNFYKNNKFGFQYIKIEVISCPNYECKKYTLKFFLHDCIDKGGRVHVPETEPKQTWTLIPAAETKMFPDYVPLPILVDYREACLIRDLSPKASATLSRRCLQGMIRDFWKIKKSRLCDEINELQNKIDPTTWAAIDSVRKIGNIGAHMEKDIDLIIEVAPEEAKLLIGLIETLIKDWYISRHEREQNMEEIIAMAEGKNSIKQQNNQNP